MKTGDIVGFRSIKSEIKFTYVGRVENISEKGIPSCPEPMLKISGYRGYVLVSHCEVVK